MPTPRCEAVEDYIGAWPIQRTIVGYEAENFAVRNTPVLEHIQETFGYR